jgi:SAM-dependent methyltransferase
MVSLSVADKFLLEVHGTCPICGPGAHFVADNAWLRDHFLCTRCGSIPRERALMAAIQMFRPEWRSLTIHESSPAFRGPSLLFKQQAPGYSHSYFDETRPLGTILPEIGGRNENIEAMTFAEHSFDMFITQDVFEHIFDPTQAIREISRVLRPSGIYIMTVPLVNRHASSCRRAERRGNEIVHLKEEQYHGNPISAKGALVTMDWGFDICFRLSEESGMRAAIIHIDDLERGIRAEFNEVIVMEKPALAELPNEFDANLYLAIHKDVADAGLDPVRHYLTYGYKEGRRLR